MNKKEFLDILYGQLIDQMPSDRASAHVRDYQTYIEEEAQKGRGEDEIFQTLWRSPSYCQDADRYRSRVRLPYTDSRRSLQPGGF